MHAHVCSYVLPSHEQTQSPKKFFSTAEQNTFAHFIKMIKRRGKKNNIQSIWLSDLQLCLAPVPGLRSEKKPATLYVIRWDVVRYTRPSNEGDRRRKQQNVLVTRKKEFVDRIWVYASRCDRRACFPLVSFRFIFSFIVTSIDVNLDL